MLVPGRFSSAAINIGDGELELRMSDGGNWQVKVRSTDAEDWRLLCRGHIDGTIFETAGDDDQEPVTVGQNPSPSWARLSAHSAESAD